MLWTLIKKELLAIILSPKFTGTFAVCSILILLSVFTGIREYEAMNERYNSASLMVDQELRQATSWGHLNSKVYRKPDPMQIFVAGLDYDVGRWSRVSAETGIKLKNSAYSDDPIFAVFRFIDFSFITKFILTLFAILFTYNAVNGEREDGTLRLVFSNAVSKARYLIGKCIGAWLGLVFPVSIPVLLSLLLVFAFGVPLTTSHWIKIIFLLGLSLALFTFFIVLGVLISSITRRSSVSFLLSLVAWVLLVMIIPRTGIMAAGHLVTVPRMAELESQLSGYSQEKWDEFFAGIDSRWAEYQDVSGNMELSEEVMWEIMEKEDSLHKLIESEIDQYDLKLKEDLRQRKTYQEELAFIFSRISPVAAYQLGAMSLAGTDVNMKKRYEDAINNYRNRFNEYVKNKQEETGDNGRVMMAISLNADGSQSMSTSGRRNTGELDIDDIPGFIAPEYNLASALNPAIKDIGLIVFFTLLAFTAAFLLFIRYDVR